MNKKVLVISLVIKSLAVILMVLGVILNIFNSGDFMAGSKSLLYFTIQSNILASLISIISIVFDIQKFRGKEVVESSVFNYFKLVATTGVTLTLIVFWAILASLMPGEYLYSIPNLTLHTFGPMLVILDYVLFTFDFKPNKKMIMIVWSFPLFYFIFVMILSLFNVSFGYEMSVPYFFLDYKNLGWFKITNSGIGVFYWVIIILFLVYGIGYGINALNQISAKRIKLV